MSGAGALQAAAVNVRGNSTVRPSETFAPPGSSTPRAAGELTVRAPAFSLDRTSVLEVLLEGTFSSEVGRLVVHGSVDLKGTLSVAPSYIPTEGEVFEFAEYASRLDTPARAFEAGYACGSVYYDLQETPEHTQLSLVAGTRGRALSECCADCFLECFRPFCRGWHYPRVFRRRAGPALLRSERATLPQHQLRDSGAKESLRDLLKPVVDVLR